MNIGEFNERVTLQTLTSSADGRGGLTADSWSSGTAYWAKVVQLDAKKMFEEGRDFQGNAYEVYFRYNEFTISTNGNSRLNYNSIALKIHSVENVKQGERFWRIIAYDA